MPRAKRPAFTEDVQSQIIALLSQGYTRSSVYRPLGVDDEQWDGAFTIPAWRHRVLAAESSFMKLAQAKILETVSTNKDDAKYFVEKRDPEYANRSKVALEIDKPTKVALKTYAIKGKAK